LKSRHGSREGAASDEMRLRAARRLHSLAAEQAYSIAHVVFAEESGGQCDRFELQS